MKSSKKLEKLKKDINQCFELALPSSAKLKDASSPEHFLDQFNKWLTDNPIPALFKEKLISRLSRYCSNPFPLICHGSYLKTLGLSGSAVLALLKEAPPFSETDLKEHFKQLSLSTKPLTKWPDEESSLEKSIFQMSEFIFISTRQSNRCVKELSHCLSPSLYEHLTGLLMYIKIFHFWVESHPEIDHKCDKRYQDNFEKICQEEPLLRDFFQNYNEIIVQERRSLEDRLTNEIEHRRQMQEELTRFVAELEDSRDRMQDQASQVARQAEELYRRRGELLQEISERKKVEESIRVYMEIVKNIPIGLNVWHMENEKDFNSFKLIATNPAVKRFTGVSLEESIGKMMKEIFPFLTEVPHIYAEVIRSGKARDMGESDYGGSQAPEGVFSVRVYPLPNNCVGVTYEDVTERKQAEEELAKARDAALELARIRSEFLANMSHEIRTPLNAIIGMSSLLSGTELSAQQTEFTTTISNASDALLAIINQILDFSKMESGKMTLESLDLDLRNLIESATELLAVRAQAKGLDVKVSIDKNVVTALRGDPTRIRQILINLLTNAVKFTDTGEVTVKASLVNETAGHATIRLAVSDTGIGIPMDAQKKLFQAFSQADTSTTRKYGGTGLGLAICKRLVELMGGEIGVVSEKEEGSTFWFVLRFEKQVSGVVVESVKENLKDLKVLLLSSNHTEQKNLKKYLSTWKTKVDTAVSGAKALHMIREKSLNKDPYKIVLLDMDISDMEGLAFALKIKSDHDMISPKLIALTSLSQPLEQDVIREAGIAACLTRPIKQSSLFDSLMSVIDELKPAGPDKQAAALHTKQKFFRILVAEDNPVNQRVAQLQLQKLGYTPHIVNSGQEAIEEIENHRYDLVFMDCQMPQMDGYQATKIIRELEGEDRHTPIVAMTANALGGDRKKCMEAGMDDYMSKPIKVDTLAAVIAKWDVSLDQAVLESLREMGDGNNKLLKDVISRFLEDTPSRLQTIHQAAEDKDAKELEKATHSLKGSSGNVGAKGLWAICEKIEALASADKLEAAIALLEDLDDEFKHLKPELEKLRDAKG